MQIKWNKSYGYVVEVKFSKKFPLPICFLFVCIYFPGVMSFQDLRLHSLLLLLLLLLLLFI
jgi:hypothetical protein